MRRLPSDAWEEFGRSIRARFEIEPNSIDTHAETRDARRALCGEHGRIVPTKQDLCPNCGGIVHVRSDRWVREMRRLSEGLLEFAK